MLRALVSTVDHRRFVPLVLVEIEPLVRLILILVRETALPGPPRRSTSPWAQRATRHAG